MANVKNFGLIGVGTNVQYGKAGSRIINNGGTFEFRNAAGAGDVAITTAGITSSAGNVTLTTGNVVMSAAAGTMSIGGDTTLSRHAAGMFQFDGTAAVVMPTGTTGQQPTAAGNTAAFRYNSTTGSMEYSNGTVWNTLATGGVAVTAVSVVSANGLAGTSSGGTTPALTLSTTVTGVLVGDGTAISAAVSGTDIKTVNGTSLLGSGDVGTINVAHGGTGVTTLTTNGVVFGNGTSPVGVTGAGTQYQVLQAGVAGVPSFGAVALDQAAAVSGILPGTNGGTGVNNGANTITLGGNFTTASGDITLTSAGPSSVTLPASGTLATVGGTVASFSAGSTGFTPNSATTGAVTLAGQLNLASGGTNANLVASDGAIVYSSSTAMALSTVGTVGQVLTSAGGGAPGWTSATDANTANAIVKRDANGDFSARFGTYAGSGSGSGVTLNGTVTNATDATTKAYVDALVQGIHVHAPTQVVQPTNIGTYTVGSGAGNGVGALLTVPTTTSIGGHTLVLGAESVADRIMVIGQTNPNENGVYYASSSTVWIRASDWDTPTEVAGGDFTFNQFGTGYANTGWVQTDKVLNFTTDPQNFIQFSGAGSYTAGAGLTLTGTVFSADTDGTTTYIDGGDNIAVKSSGTADQVLRSAGSGSATWGAVNLASSAAVTNTLAANHGGTGFAAYTIGDILYADTAATLTKLGVGATGTVLHGGTVPAYSAVSLTADVSGILPAANGGTGVANSNTITLGGDLTTIGGFASNFTMTGTTNVTFPTSGTLATTAGSVASISTGTTGLLANGVNTPETGAVTLSGTLIVANGGTGATSFTAGRVLLGDGTNPVATDADLAFNAGTNALTVGSATLTGTASGSVTLAATTAPNADINLIPNGTGAVIIGPAGAGLIQSDPLQPLTVRGKTVLTLESGTGDIVMLLSGTTANKVTISGPTAAQYATSLANEDLVNKYYVDTVAGSATGDVKAVKATVDLTDGTTNIGAALPAGATILSVKVNVTSVDTGSGTLVVGKSGNTSAYMTAVENDTQVQGLYLAETSITEAASEQVISTGAGATSGSAVVIVTYMLA